MMKTMDSVEYVLAFSDARSDLGLVGGKGASLSRLSAEGFPVPPGFHVTTEAYREFVEANGLSKLIEVEIAGLDADRPDEIERASARVRGAFLASPVTAAIDAAVCEAYALLRGEASRFGGAPKASEPGREPAWPAVAVRSSATAEDLPGLSFAGQQESFLDVRGPEALVGAVRRCWASLWNGRAVAYRLARRYAEADLALAVVVQLLVDADAAGVLFTADPVSGRRGVAVIDAAFGLGESVVGGRVSPDVLVVEKRSGRVLERATADKELRTVRLPGGGTAEEPCPEELRRAPVLSDEEAEVLASLGSRVEASYGTPMDIEWARAEGRFWLLQARPITALPDEEPEPPAEWLPPSPKAVIARASIVEFIPEPVTPLFESFGIRVYEVAFKETIEELTGKAGTIDGIDYCAVVNGYLYIHTKFPARYFLAVAGALGRIWKRLKDVRPALEAARERYRKAASPWESRDLGCLAAGELLAGAEALWGEACRFVQTFQTGAAGAGSFELLLGRIWEKGLRRPGEPPASALVLGYENEASRAEAALWDLAQAARSDAALAAWLKAAPVKLITAALGGTDEFGRPGAERSGTTAGEAPPEGVSAAIWTEFRTAFRAHLDRFGRAVFDLDFSKPLPSDQPEAFILAMRNWLEGGGSDPRARRAEAARRREELSAAALARARGLKGRLFRWALGLAQNATPLREDAIAGFGIGYPALRRILRELGSRLALGGALQAPEDVFWLEEGELRAAAAALDHGSSLADLREAARDRRSLWRSRKRVRPPMVVPKVERIMGFKVSSFLPSEESQGPGAIRGVGASGGKVRAPARVLREISEMGSMRAGEVLVAEITTPAWTPLFALASAVVTDIGGPLSHSSIVAREFGIPAVLGTGLATRRIRTGDLVLVDGDAGRVTWDEAAS